MVLTSKGREAQEAGDSTVAGAMLSKTYTGCEEVSAHNEVGKAHIEIVIEVKHHFLHTP